MLEPSTSDRQQLLWRCYRYLQPYWRLVASIYGLLLVISALSVLTPQFIRWIVDRGIVGQDLLLLRRSVLALLGVTLLKGILTFFQHRWVELSSQSVAYDLRNAIHHKLTELSFAYHDQSEAGQLLSRSLQDVERIRFLTGRATLRVVEGVVLFVVTAAVLMWMNGRLALLVTLTLPLIAYRAVRFGGQYRPLSVRIQDQLGVLTSRLEQNLRGARVVKAFAQETSEAKRFEQDNEHWFDLSAKSIALAAVNMPLLDLIANIGVLLVLGYGGWLVIEEQLTLGELVAFTTYLAQLAHPVRVLGMVLPAIAIASSAAERIFAILDAPAEVADAPDATPLRTVAGEVQFRNVCFTYRGKRTILHDISFHVQPGQVVALMGATGAGKSTVVNLLARFYDPDKGQILIDGIDIRQVRLASLRRHIGIVLQDTMLFAATVRENIAFGRPDATEADIIAAAQSAQAHEFITTQLAFGYDTMVGEQGTTLSGGQKQRIAIARALLTDPRLLLLDDATASVDTGTEQLIQKALQTLMQGRTTFVIAHRLSTVRRADLILLLEKGHIVARGTHQQLLEHSSRYAEIYQRQLRPTSAPTMMPGQAIRQGAA